MARRAAIEIDLGIGEAPTRWNAAWVQARVVEAYSIERKLPGVRKIVTGTAWPTVNYTFADKVGWPDARERVLDEWMRSAGGAFAHEITRMDEAHEWLRVYLAKHEVERVCLSAWGATQAYHRSLSALLRKRDWPRRTFYRYRDTGAHIIAMALEAKGEPVT